MDGLAQDAAAARQRPDHDRGHHDGDPEGVRTQRDELRSPFESLHESTLRARLEHPGTTSNVSQRAGYLSFAADANSWSSVPSAITRSPSSRRMFPGGLTFTVPSLLRTASTLAASGVKRPASSSVCPSALVPVMMTISSTPIPASP